MSPYRGEQGTPAVSKASGAGSMGAMEFKESQDRK
jgi:hypothetical protein